MSTITTIFVCRLSLRSPHDDLSYGDINQQDKGIFLKDVITLNQPFVLTGQVLANYPRLTRRFGDLSSSFFKQLFTGSPCLEDFAPFQNLSLWDAQRVKNSCRFHNSAACFVVQIKDGQIYIAEEKPGFQSRTWVNPLYFSAVGHCWMCFVCAG